MASCWLCDGTGRYPLGDEMTCEKIIKLDMRRYGDEMVIPLHYPDAPGNVKRFVIDLGDVRAADGIRIGYDKERDGWVIEQASTFSWESDDGECDPDWQEVAFVEAWAREKGGSA